MRHRYCRANIAGYRHMQSLPRAAEFSRCARGRMQRPLYAPLGYCREQAAAARAALVRAADATILPAQLTAERAAI